MSEDRWLSGRLLVATPDLRDPNFARTVVLMIEHGPEGALGVVLNRATGVPVDDPLTAWADLVAEPVEYFRGGPVGEQAVIGLGLVEGGVHVGDADGFTPIPELLVVGAVDLARPPGDVYPPVGQVRMFVSYSGWSAGQLESECDAGGWFVVDALPSDVFTEHPETLWADVLRRQGGRLGMFALCPPDPSVN